MSNDSKEREHKKRPKNDSPVDKVDFESFVRAALATGKAPPLPKKPKPKGKK